MRKIVFITALLLIIANAVTAQEKQTLSNIGNENTNQASFKFTDTEYNFGNIKQGTQVSHTFEFINEGKEPLVITQASAGCGCTVPDWPKEPIAAGKKGSIKVTFNSAGKMGSQERPVTIQSNAKQNPMTLYLKGNVEKPDDSPADSK